MKTTKQHTHTTNAALKPSAQRSTTRPAPASTTILDGVRKEVLVADGQTIEYEIRKHQKAKRVSLKVSHDGRVWISVPPRASLAQARKFAQSNITFIQKALHRAHQKREEQRKQREEEPLRLPVAGEWANVWIQLSDSYAYRYDAASRQCIITLPRSVERSVERFTPYHLRTAAIAYWRYQMIQQANAELPARTLALAQSINTIIRRVTVRDQRTVWGSCSSARKSISLNWRCVVFPAEVRDYLILHELAHLRHPNHSDAYWQWVETICPWYEQAEQWLTKHGRAIMDITTL